ncbi:MAG TPA: NADH:flavin oxidoreductase/NADH oxidase [Anaerolineales bacterium]|nr:NADH:flavin oxidoreductase/NADH oxidase [Anaerolineales bacterium]
MPNLFDPFTLRGITLRNRIGMPPMCQYSAVDGLANDWHLAHYGARAVGGMGLIIIEATAVEPRGRITPNDLGLWDDAQIEPLARIVHFLKAHGAVAGIQIAHAGRKACTYRPWDAPASGPIPPADPHHWQVVGASPLPFSTSYPVPHTLQVDEIYAIQEAFAAAARRAQAAGFEWLELHAAHGYLLHSFYSPLANQRTDTYGGSFDNRTRFVLETAAKVRQAWPQHLPLTARLSCTDWVEDGWTCDDSVLLARQLKAAGFDLVDCSSGGNGPTPPAVTGPGYQVPLAEAVRHSAGIATAAVGLITAPEQADEVIFNGRADIVLVGRAALRDPHWPLHAAQVLKKDGPVPGQYRRAF